MTDRRRMISWAMTTLRRAAWAPILVFLIHVIGLLVFDIYERIPDFDVLMHFLGGVAIAHFFGAAYRTAAEQQLIGSPAPVLFPVAMIGWTAIAAVIWEFAEFTTDRVFQAHSQPGLADTMLDLLMGLLGGVAYSLYASDRSEKPQAP